MKFDTFDISDMPISILMLKMIFYQIFANCSAQIGPKRKNAQNFLKIAWVLFQICWSRFWWQKWVLLNYYHHLSQNQKCPKFIKTWNIWYFKYADLNVNVKNNFYEIFITFSTQSVPKIKNAQKLLKFDTLDVSNMRSPFWCQKWFLWKIDPLFDPNWFQN